jgi:hypothetical protein
MKNFTKFAILPALALALSSGDVSAGATASAAGCHVINGTDVLFAVNGIINESINPLSVQCEIPIDHQLGATVTFRVRMFDNSTVDGANTLCLGYVNDQDGNEVGVTPLMTSGTGTFSGTVTRTATVTVSPQSNSHTYSVGCLIAGGYSGLSTVRVF